MCASILRAATVTTTSQFLTSTSPTMTTISQEAPPSCAIMTSEAPPTNGLSLLLQFARHLFSSVSVVGINHNTGALRLELKFTPEMAEVVNTVAHFDRCLLIRAVGKLMYNMHALQQIDKKNNNIPTAIFSEYSKYQQTTKHQKHIRKKKSKVSSAKSAKSATSAKSANAMSSACAEDQTVQEQTSAVDNLLSLYELEVVAVGGDTVTLTPGDTLQWASTMVEGTIGEQEQMGLSAEGVAEVPEVRCSPEEMIVEPFMTLDEESGLLTHVSYNDVIDAEGQHEDSGDLEPADQEIRVEYDHDSGKTFFTF